MAAARYADADHNRKKQHKKNYFNCHSLFPYLPRVGARISFCCLSFDKPLSAVYLAELRFLDLARGISRNIREDYLSRALVPRKLGAEFVDLFLGCAHARLQLDYRRRDLPELTASNFATRSFGERVALNMPIQGTAADVMKLAMVRVHDRLRREAPEAKLLLQVHDELIVECPEELAERVARLLTEEMEGVMSLSVPLVAEAHWGKNWLEAK